MYRKGEIVSASCLASARGLGKLAALMANKGALGEQRLISEETWNDMLSEPKEE